MAKGSKLGYRDVISSAILRTLSQAKYTPIYGGHFGLNLTSYTHFTSPIRRYSDILIHRFLIKIHGWEESKYETIKNSDLNEIGEHLSFTERRSMIAERETNERYTARFLSTAIGQDLDATISGISKSGIFIRLHKTGGDGLIPMSSLAGDRFLVNSTQTKMKGRNSKFSFDLGAKVIAKLVASNPISGSLILNLVEYEGKLIDQLLIPKSRRNQKFKQKKNKRR